MGGGGGGISIGNRLTVEEIETVRKQVKESPRKYVAQPILSLSVHPTYIDETESFEQRHVDLRNLYGLGQGP